MPFQFPGVESDYEPDPEPFVPHALSERVARIMEAEVDEIQRQMLAEQTKEQYDEQKRNAKVASPEGCRNG